MSNIVHAAYAKRSKLPTRVKREVRFVKSALVEEVAGTPDRLTASQIILIDRIIFKFAACRCVEEYAKANGFLDDKGNMRPILDRNFISWSNSMRLDLTALNSQRKPEDLLEVDWSESVEESAADDGQERKR